MWTCPVCNERHDDQFKECWKCVGQAQAPQPVFTLRCLRCEIPLTPMGTQFLKLESGGVLARSLDFNLVQQGFDLYGCQRCGKVEFFLPNIGRGERQAPDEP